MKKVAVVMLATAFALPTWAQGPKTLGSVADVNGLVTVSSGDQLSNAVKGMKLPEGSRVITTSGGTAVLKFDNGCEVKLLANQSVTISDTKECAALLAAVKSVAPTVAAAPAGTGAAVAAAGASTSYTIPALIAGAAVLAGLVKNNQSSKTSGS